MAGVLFDKLGLQIVHHHIVVKGRLHHVNQLFPVKVGPHGFPLYSAFHAHSSTNSMSQSAQIIRTSFVARTMAPQQGQTYFRELCLELEPFRPKGRGRTRLNPSFPRPFTKASPSGESLVTCQPYFSPFSTIKAPVASAVALNFLLWYRPEREVS